jgi:hypothetical protein
MRTGARSERTMSDEKKADDARQPETESILLVYVGSRIGKKDKLLDLWVAVTPEQFQTATLPTEDEGHDTYRVYDGKESRKYMTGSPGSVYEVPQVKGSTSIFSHQARYKCLWPDEEQRLKWQVEHRTATTTNDLRRKAKKESSEDNFATLRPVREKYARLVSQDQRAALLAQVIAFITAGK